MAVPEAAVDEDDGPVFAQYEVGMSRQARMIQPIPEASAEQELPHQHLRAGGLALYG